MGVVAVAQLTIDGREEEPSQVVMLVLRDWLRERALERGRG